MTGLITDYVAQGLIADRPVAPEAPDASLSWYFATDTGVMWFYNWDEAEWQINSAPHVVLSQSAYDALDPPNADTFYYIPE